jgi:hypothetical protein
MWFLHMDQKNRSHNDLLEWTWPARENPLKSDFLNYQLKLSCITPLKSVYGHDVYYNLVDTEFCNIPVDIIKS